ncbi:MAG: hypothetical protein Q6356_007090 [Candidatus Wukongarchaeota archaeon]|nr:hypothetical protein [Candidatus Wukongarchaeota archaeon]
MKDIRWQVMLGIFLIILSVIVYFIHFLIFHDSHHIFIYFVGDVAFVFIEVLLVTLLLHQLLEMREKKSRLEKLNMVIGAFYSEVGTNLLIYFSNFDPSIDQIKKDLIVTKEWTHEEFLDVSKKLKQYNYGVTVNKLDLERLHSFLVEKRFFLVRLLENQNLLEHETFTDLLWAVFHLTEELDARKQFKDLPDTDVDHLKVDVERVYSQLVDQWVEYMEHLKDSYPYLFSLAMRTNPFDETATPIVH